MSDERSRLELLPNEILLDTFQYVDTGEVYRAFYNLNSRFNGLLLSIDKPCLTLRTFNSNEMDFYKTFSTYVYQLKLGDEVNINPNDFNNICYLQLFIPSNEQLKLLELDVYPYLEHLLIDCENIDFMMVSSALWMKILLNGFSCLKSCNFYNSTSTFTIPDGSLSCNLMNLKIGVINLRTYVRILSVCPNLSVFQFTICSISRESFVRVPHSNLTRLIIQFGRHVAPIDDCKIDDYLSFVPNLKELIVYQRVYKAFFQRYFTYNWFALYIVHHLPSLQQLKFYLSVVHLEKSFLKIEDSILNAMQKRFKELHNNQYRSELIINQSTIG